MTSCLCDLTKNNHFRWEQHHHTALDTIKKDLCSITIISYYDTDSMIPTILHYAASQNGSGASNRQIDSCGREKVIAMASRSLTETESRYSDSEHECLSHVQSRKVQILPFRKCMS